MSGGTDFTDTTLKLLSDKTRDQIKNLDYLIIENFDERSEKDEYSKKIQEVIRSCVKSEISMKIIKEAEMATKEDLSSQTEMEGSIDALFQDNFQKLINMTDFESQIKEDPSMIQHKDLLHPKKPGEDDDVNGLDHDLVSVEEHSSHIDPISKLPMTDPVRNTKCNHVYNRDSIMQMLKSKAAKKKGFRCPYVGCSNKNPVKADHLIDAHDIRKLIERRKREDED